MMALSPPRRFAAIIAPRRLLSSVASWVFLIVKTWACAWVSNMEPKQTKLRNNLVNDLFINGIVYPNDVRMLSGFPNHAIQFAHNSHRQFPATWALCWSSGADERRV